MQISSWQEAERNAARWMRHWGYLDAIARPGGQDAGIDVHATDALGQVKYQAAHVGRPELQRFVGARPFGSTAQLIFFTGSGYSATAVAYALDWNVALFTYSLDGAMTPVNDMARRLHSVSAYIAPPAAEKPQPTGKNAWWRLNWPVVAGICFLMAPLGSIGDEATYTGSPFLNVLKFIGILMACWTIGALLIAARLGFRLSLQTRPFRAVVSRTGRSVAGTLHTTHVRPRARPGRSSPQDPGG